MRRAASIPLWLLMLFGAAPVLAAPAVAQSFAGRTLLVYVPAHLPSVGERALVIVLHGGLGNAQRIESAQSESALNMDSVAENNGFIVAYLNGTPVTRRLSADMLGWNAGGGCCGLAAQNNIDDVGYIGNAIDHLAAEYGVDRSRIYGIGHSNGAMMTQRVVCEAGIYAAVVAISGPLNLDVATCTAARGRRVLAIHGAEDENVPLKGGRGRKGVSNATYRSEDLSRRIMINSGATYELQVVQGADHKLEDINSAIQSTQSQSIAEKAAIFFGLSLRSPN